MVRFGSMVFDNSKDISIGELIEIGRQRFEAKNPGHKATHAAISHNHPDVQVDGLVVEYARNIPQHIAFVGEGWTVN